ncbi:MAG: type II toxin-antitoxin system HicA family toxin [Verrucomicrobiota bacterium]
MPQYPDVSGEDAVEALKRLGFIFLRLNGSHAILSRGDSGCVVPMHREINRSTFKSVLLQAGVSLEKFESNL